MKFSLLLVALAGLVLAVAAVLFIERQIRLGRTHEPVEYYMGWGSYRHPIVLQHRITKEAADALNAAGAVYLVAHYDGDGRLTSVVKFYRREIFFNISTRTIPTAG